MSTTPVYTYTYDHIHVRTKYPEDMASFFETISGIVNGSRGSNPLQA